MPDPDNNVNIPEKEEETRSTEQPEVTAPEDMPAAPAEEAQSGQTEADAGTEEDSTPKNRTNGVNGIGLGMSLCDAVLYAVGRDRFHGGIRPDNISVRDGQGFLGGPLQHNVGEFTPQELEYMAPELFWDGVRSPSADVYSLGLVLYSLYN